MRWFRLLHLLIIGSLGLFIFALLTSSALLLRPSVKQLEQAKSQLAELLEKPAALRVDAVFTQSEKLQLKFGNTRVSTESSSLLRHL